jgi:hypothetical protein
VSRAIDEGVRDSGIVVVGTQCSRSRSWLELRAESDKGETDNPAPPTSFIGENIFHVRIVFRIGLIVQESHGQAWYAFWVPFQGAAPVHPASRLKDRQSEP